LDYYYATGSTQKLHSDETNKKHRHTFYTQEYANIGKIIEIYLRGPKGWRHYQRGWGNTWLYMAPLVPLAIQTQA